MAARHAAQARATTRAQTHNDEPRGGAVCVRDDEAARRRPGSLRAHELQVAAIDWRHDERHVRRHAVVARVREDGDARVAEGRLHLASHIRVQRRKDQLRASHRRGRARHDSQRRRPGGHVGRDGPARGRAVQLPRAARRGAQPVHGKERVRAQQRNETLPHRTSRTQDAHAQTPLRGWRGWRGHAGD